MKAYAVAKFAQKVYDELPYAAAIRKRAFCYAALYSKLKSLQFELYVSLTSMYPGGPGSYLQFLKLAPEAKFAKVKEMWPFTTSPLKETAFSKIALLLGVGKNVCDDASALTALEDGA